MFSLTLLLLLCVGAAAAALNELFDARYGHVIGDGETQPSTCTPCMLVVSLAYAVTKDGDILSQLDTLCATLFPNKNSTQRKVCDSLAAEVAKLTPAAMAFMLEREYTAYHLCAMLDKCIEPCCLDSNGAPGQVQIMPGHAYDTMQVMWTTSLRANQTASIVQYGTAPGALHAQGKPDQKLTYTKGGWRGLLHNVTLSGLAPRTQYYYRVGNSINGWSKVFKFRSLPKFNAKGGNDKLKFIVLADFGSENYSDPNTRKLIQMAAQDEFDVFVHNGDTAYADGVEHAWDVFMRKMEPVQASKYTLRSVGNHEIVFNFKAFLSRFSPPYGAAHSASPMWWSVDIGNVHFVTLSGERADNQAYVPADEVAWLKGDLARWNATRTKNQWLVAQIHRGLYCGSSGGMGPWHHSDCDHNAAYLRSKFEDLLYAYRADIVFQAHKHSYERALPVYKSKLNAAAPNYITIGTGGNREGRSCGWLKPVQPWFVSQLCNWGYGAMEANDTHLVFQFMKMDDEYGQKYSLGDELILQH